MKSKPKEPPDSLNPPDALNNVGEVFFAQGNLTEALESYRGGLAIRDRLSKLDPVNSGWCHDITVSFDKVGDVLVAQGRSCPRTWCSLCDHGSSRSAG
jgi:hypothetical protein